MRKRTDGDSSRDLFDLRRNASPFSDEFGNKGWFTVISRARRRVVRHLNLEIAGWPRWSCSLRIAFLSDFHVGSHSDDIARLNLIIDEAASATPDLVLFGRDRQHAIIWWWACAASNYYGHSFTPRSAARSFRRSR